MEIKHQDNDRAERKEFSTKVWMFDYLETQLQILRLRALPLRNTRLHRKTCVENKDKKSCFQTAFIFLPKHHNSFKKLFSQNLFTLLSCKHTVFTYSVT